MKSNIDNITATILDLRSTLNRSVLVVIDGRSGSGKSTIAKEIADRTNGIHIVADDFWVGGADEYWLKKTPEERWKYALNYSRVRKEVLEPLLSKKRAKWHPFDWKNNKPLADEYITAEPKALL